MRFVSTRKRCILGACHYDGGVPPGYGKRRKQKGHVHRFLDRLWSGMKRSLGEVRPDLRACAREDFRPSPRNRQRARMDTQRRDPQYRLWYSLPWHVRNEVRLALRSEPVPLTLDEMMDRWEARS